MVFLEYVPLGKVVSFHFEHFAGCRSPTKVLAVHESLSRKSDEVIARCALF